VALDVLAVLSDSEALSLLGRVLAEHGDRLTLARDLDDALARISSEAPDAALVDVSLGDANGKGVAIVEQACALSPRTAVFAVAPEQRADLVSKIGAIDCAGLLPLPFRSEALRAALLGLRGEPAPRTSSDLVLDLFDIGEAPSQREASERLAARLAAALSASRVLVYLGAGEDARQLLRTAALGPIDSAPSFGLELDLLDYARREGLSVMRFATRRDSIGFALLGGVSARDLRDDQAALLGAVGTLALALAGARERSHRAAIKDPESSAYTFAYFVDVAGREIDMARRHARRFALATITVRGPKKPGALRREPTLEAAERVLAAVRDTDVLARVDENEFYLLLPETGRIGALSCQRRVLSAFRLGPTAERLQLAMGLSTFPHDGTDLSRLLRVAKHRAEASTHSVTEVFGLRELPFNELVDTLLGQVSMLNLGASPETPRYIELPVMDAIALAIGVLREAVRGGEARIVATRHSGMSIGGAVRAEIVRDVEGARLDVVDVSTIAGAENVDILAVVGQHAVYALVGRSQSGLVRAVHSTDPALVDLLFERLADGAGARWPER
jgi:GGDEF domain-containing protein/DNA-binding response OmpR family regulator